jgi:hypothetical protein
MVSRSTPVSHPRSLREFGLGVKHNHSGLFFIGSHVVFAFFTESGHFLIYQCPICSISSSELVVNQGYLQSLIM